MNMSIPGNKANDKAGAGAAAAVPGAGATGAGGGGQLGRYGDVLKELWATRRLEPSTAFHPASP